MQIHQSVNIYRLVDWYITNMNNKSDQSTLKAPIEKTVKNNTEIIVHAMRILVKVGISLTLYISNNTFAFPLTVALAISEILDQLTLLLVRTKPSLSSAVKIFYVLNSVAIISTVAYFANWILNDFYLVYLIHISSATLAYGVKTGIISSVLSIIIYVAMLVVNQAPLDVFIRLPLLSVLVLRLAMSQGRFEIASSALNNILSIEKSKQDFIAIASHNLRTPVAAIYGYIEVLMRGDAGNLSDGQKTYIQRIKSNNQELEKLTEQLLQVSILEVGKEVNLMKQQSQIEVVIQDIVDNFIPLAQTKGLSLRFEKESGVLPLVDIDIEKIKSVLLNLLDNAIKYTEKGSVTVFAKQAGDFIAVSVKDTGVGIAREEMPKIFTKFYRSGNILIYNKIGIGLGLYLGKQIIELHGGKMTIESVEGQGSTFTFTLPIIKQDVLK